MKALIYLLTTIIFVSCGAKKNAVQTIKTVDLVEINKTVPYEETVILLGRANEDGLKQEPFNSWYEENYSDYTVDATSTASLNYLLKDLKIKVFLGTWCDDSKREIPHFYKILDAAGFDTKNIELIALSEQKDTPEGFEVGLNINYVPTFIFFKNDKEINRIVEAPITSLEQDMIAILTGQAYKHTYVD